MPALSQRGQERLTQLGSVSPFTEGYYDPKTNPNGLINLGTAENSLLSNELLDVRVFRTSARPATDSHCSTCTKTSV